MEHGLVRSKIRLVVLAAVLTQLGACSSVPNAVNPIAWYRGITGASKNDDLGKGQNDANLQEGSNEPYPNLGTVPDAPETALSTIDRDKLVDSLIADRNNAKYANDSLRAGVSAAGVAPPPPPPAPGAPKTATSAAPAGPQPSAAPANPLPSSKPAAAPSPQAQAPDKLAKVEAPARGSEAPPAESSLQSPKIDNPPQGEAVTPAPPPPRIPPAGAAAAKPPARTQASAATPPTDTIMAAPPPPQIPPPGRMPAPSPEKTASAAPTASQSGEQHGVSRHVADVTFPPGSALLSDKLRDTIDSIVKQHSKDGGRIRVVGYGEAVGANAATTGFNLALDRAQAVAVALSDSGVPSKDISVEAAPVPASGGRDVPRAEVFFDH
ncbi:MAG TPA: OmpA family protein [Stellaceae bacterium]|nr:OmpA family protein [Stellaceae bacterium]